MSKGLFQCPPICGSDLHIYNGSLPQLRPMVMGHEFMGIVEEIGSDVRNLKKGDRIIVPFPIACGHCFFAIINHRAVAKTATRTTMVLKVLC